MNQCQWKEITGKRSEVWKHFQAKSGDDSVVKCKYCTATFSAKQSTSALIYHLEKVEKVNLKNVNSVDKVKDEVNMIQPTIKTSLKQKEDPPELN